MVFVYSDVHNVKGKKEMIIRKATNRETMEIIKHAPIVVEEATMGHIKADQESALQLVSPCFSNDGLPCFE